MKALPTLEAALEGLTDAAEITDLDGRFVYVNPAFARLTGHPADTLVGEPVERVHRHVSRSDAASGWSERLEAKSRDGSKVLFDGTFSAVRGDDGAPAYTFGLLRDVTSKLVEEQALRKREALYRQIFHSNQAIKLLIDPITGKIEDANEGAVDFYGYAIEELRGLNIDRINTLPRERVREALVLTEQRGPRTFRFRHRLKSGEVKEVEVFSGAVDVGDRSLLLSIIHDVSERARVEEQLARAQRMESLGRLAGGVAHDFNNLLFVILNEVRLVTRSLGANDPLRVDAERIREAATRAAELTRHLLLFARGGDVTPEPSNVEKTLRGVVSLVASSLGHDVRVRVEAGPPVVAYVATTQLEQVLINLLMNAREAMPKGGEIVVRIGVTAVSQDPFRTSPRSGDYAHIEVSDTGIGMPPDVSTHVFEPFFTTKGPKQGTGLGLAITYGIVQRAGGSISVESEVGVGTTFRILLPLADVKLSPRVPVLGVDNAPRPFSVLFVESDPTTSAEVQRTLADAGFVATMVSSHEEAHVVAQQSADVDLLVTELYDPEGRSGAELAERILRERPTMRVLFVSSDAGAQTRRDTLSKPYDRTELLRFIHETLD